MATNLIITETALAACSIAFAFNGIVKDDGDTITYKQRLQHEDAINMLLKKGHIKAKKNNDDFIIIWPQSPVQQKNSNFAKLYEETKVFPFTPEKYEIELKELFADTLKKIIIQKQIKEVFIAYSTKTSSTLIAGAIANFLPKETHVKVTCIELQAFTKHYILSAFNNPISDVQLKNRYNRICRKKLIAWSIRENLSYAFNLCQGTNYKLDQYMFYIMSELNEKNSQKKSKELLAEAQIDMKNINVKAVSQVPLTPNEAKHVANLESVEASFEGPYATSFLTTADLMRYCEKNPEITIQDFIMTIDSLFYKGYITNPYTKSSLLPTSFNNDDCQMLLKLCNKISGNTFTEDHLTAIKKAITKNREQRALPILPLNASIDTLTGKEQALYKYIVNKTINTVNENVKNNYTVLIDNIKYICELPTEKSKALKRGTKTFPASVRIVKETQGKSMTTQQLFKRLADTKISDVDDIFPVLIYLSKNNFINMHGKSITLLPDASKIYDALTVKELKKPTLFNKWGKSAESDNAGNEALTKREIQLTLLEWVPVFLQMTDLNFNPDVSIQSSKEAIEDQTAKGKVIQPKESVVSNMPKEEPFANVPIEAKHEIAPATEAKAPVDKKSVPTVPAGKPTSFICPLCGSKLFEEESLYHCNECNFIIQKKYSFKEGVVMITENDVKELLTNKVTGLKVAKNIDKESIPGTLFIDTEFKINFTNRSSRSCPYCKKPLEFYSWGMGCSECDFAVPFIIYGKKIDPENYKKLITGQRTEKIDDLIMQDGQTFSAVLKIDRTGRLKLYRE